MANLNKVMLIGRLTRDPDVRTFGNGGKVVNVGFAVNNRKKNTQTGQYEDEAVFLDCEAFDSSGDSGRKTASLIEQYLRKGHQAYIEGRLKLDQWQDKNDGSKRSKIKVVIDNVQFLEPKTQDGASNQKPPRQPPATTQHYNNFDAEPDMGGGHAYSAYSADSDDIPF